MNNSKMTRLRDEMRRQAMEDVKDERLYVCAAILAMCGIISTAALIILPVIV